MPVLDTAAKYRQVADRLADAALAATGETPGEDDLSALVEAGMAGKAALEAASAADVGPGPIAAALAGLREEIAELELDDAAFAEPADFLRVLLHELRARRDRVAASQGQHDAMRVAYLAVARRLLAITQGAEQTGQEGSLRVARQNRRALEESVIALEHAGISIPIRPEAA